jgi:arylsulfatase A-like enzyme/Flp pilus assembly protein TadD
MAAVPENVRRSMSGRRLVPVVGLSLVLVAVAYAAWDHYASRQTATGGVALGALPRGTSRERLNLVVVTLDTTRADRVGAYGRAGASLTPVFDRLAAEGVLFEQAMTSAPLTLPAHATMFTGAYPSQHGVRDNGGFFLDPGATTLAERLQGAGFRTGAFVGAFVLDSKWGLDQGFERYVDDFALAEVRGGSLGDVSRRAAEVVDGALPWLEEVQDQRFFAWLHFYDAHAPYDPPEPFATRFRQQPYNGEIAYVDAQLGRVIEFLASRGLLERTIVAVLGDHGEGLGEHDEGTHGFFVYETATHVPFLIRAPFEAARGRRVAGAVRTADLTPTLLDLLGLPAVETSIPGRSLAAMMTGTSAELGADGYAEAMYPLHHYGWSAPRAIRSGPYKLIDAPRPELFDLSADPGETTNLFDSRREVANRLQRSLRALEAGFARAGQPAAADTVDPETRARLASLGYVSSFVATADDEAGEVRADPKDKIALFNLMSEAQDLRDDPAALDRRIALLQRVVADDPKVIDAWFNLGNAHYRAGRHAEAIGYFARALELKPDYDLALINMANAYRAQGRDDEALAGYEHYLRVDPKNAWVHYQAGEIHLDRGDLDRATTAFNAALAIDPKVAPARVALGAVAVSRGDAATAERETRDALATTPGVRLAHFNLGVIAEARGDVETALAEYRREYERHADAYKALFNAARLLQQRGSPEARTLFARAVAINTRFAEGHFYLAQAELAAGDLAAAAAAARAGLALDARSGTAPLGHFVLADVAMRQGRLADAARALEAGKALEARHARPAAPR